MSKKGKITLLILFIAVITLGVFWGYRKMEKDGEFNKITEKGTVINTNDDADLILAYNTFPGMEGILLMNGGKEPNESSELYQKYGILLQIKQQTLGANFWQKLKHVQWKYVISRLSDDIRILVGISWTYVIVAELKNVEGGIGKIIFMSEKSALPHKVYMCVFIIVLIGILQDRIFKWLDKVIFKFKHV